MNIKRHWLYIKHRLLFDIRHGGGRFGKLYVWIGKRFNPAKPWFWRKNRPPEVQLPDEYIDIIPHAYWTGDGWELGWSAVHEADYFPDSLIDVVDIRDDDALIFDWPFFLPIASSDDLERAGFYII